MQTYNPCPYCTGHLVYTQGVNADSLSCTKCKHSIAIPLTNEEIQQRVEDAVQETKKREATWDDRFLEKAMQFTPWSKDPSTQVGCVIVNEEDKIILSTGLNGLPRGVRDLPERMERPQKYLWTAHAEENAVANAARVGIALKGMTAYVTHYPCSRCARTLVQAGIARVVVGPGTTSMPPEEFEVAAQIFEEANIKITQK